MAKEKLSLEQQTRQASIDWLDCKIQRDAKWQEFFDAQVAYDAIEKIYKRSKKEWVKAQNQFVKAARRRDRLLQQLKDANQADHAAGAKSGQSRPHGNSGG